jgi:hypothetical protein
VPLSANEATCGQPARQRTAGDMQRSTILGSFLPTVGLLQILRFQRRIVCILCRAGLCLRGLEISISLYCVATQNELGKASPDSDVMDKQFRSIRSTFRR